MQVLYFWPSQPALSLLALWLVSSVFLWAAREPMLRGLRGLFASIETGLNALASSCRTTAEERRERNRETLLAAGTLELHGRLDREFQCIDAGFSDKLADYGRLHRRLDSLLVEAEASYAECGNAPPEAPGWASAVESIANIPSVHDPNVHKVLEGIRKSLQESEKTSLDAYRSDSARRHKILSGMLGVWKEVRHLLSKMNDSVARALETTNRVRGYFEAYTEIREDREQAARALTYSAVKLFTVSAVVLVIALGGAFINFQLIALPMSELVSAGTRVGGVSVATVAALVIVLMESVLGFFVMDMLGISDLFPKLAHVRSSRRKLILGLALGGLFFLASVEASLAILREQIVQADAALKLALASSAAPEIQAASTSRIPLIGQAVLGFVLPWILAMVAVPLEMLLDSGRHIAAGLAAWSLAALGHFAQVLASATRAGSEFVLSLYDVYIAIPLRIEAALAARTQNGSGGTRGPRRVAAAASGEGAA